MTFSIRVSDTAYARQLLACNPREEFCECEAEECSHHRGCRKVVDLADYRVAGIRQTLCPTCADHAHSFCRADGYEFEAVPCTP